MNKIVRKMVKIFGSVSQYSSERRDYEKFSGLQCSCDNSMAELGQVVFICSSDLFDKAMGTKTFEHARYLMGSFAGKVFFDLSDSEAADVELTANNGLEQIKVITRKEIESAIASAIVVDRSRNLLDVFLGRSRVVDSGDKVDIASVGGTEQFGEHIQAVDIFLQRRQLHLACAISMFHHSVVFKKGNVIDGGFNAQHKAMLVVHFDRHLSHVMFNTCSLYTGVKVIAHFILITAMETSSQKCGDVVGLDGMYRCPDQFFIDGSKIALSLKNNVGGVFSLHDAPVIAILKESDDRAVQAGISVEYPVNAFDVDVVSQFLRLIKVFHAHKTIVKHGRINAFIDQLSRQFVMAVEIELEAKRRPCRHSEITQAHLCVDEIEVIMQTFAAVVLEERFVGIFVMPGLIARAWFHCRENVYEAGMFSSLGDDIFDPLFLAKVLFADEVNGKAVLRGNSFRILAYLFSQRQCPLGIVENTDAVECQKPRHSLSIADAGDGSGQNNTIKTGSNTFDFITMSFNEIGHARSFQHNCIAQLSEKCRAA